MAKKTILITGSGSGIGRDSALALARRGHSVLATTHYEDQARELNSLARERSLTLDAFKLDVTLPEDREQVLQYAVDVLINNAGIGESGSLAEMDINLVRSNFETNLFSAFELTQLVLRGMMKRDAGTILFISSLAGRAPVMPFLSSYSMTKYALSAGAEALRNEIKQVRKNVHVSVIEPGSYHTGFNQRIIATKFRWMDASSYFYKHLKKIKRREDLQFRLTEQKSTDSIVKKIVQASESATPKLRYVAPWWQGLGVRLLRMLGK